jgi:CysZ protein
MPDTPDPVARAGLPPLPATPIQQVLHGALAPARGARWLLEHPSLWRWVALPIALTVGSILAALGLTWRYADDLLALWWPQPDGGLAVVWAVVYGVFVVSLFVASTAFLWILGHIVAGPLYDRLAAEVEASLVQTGDEPFDWSVAIGDAAQSFVHSILGLTAYILFAAPLLLINLVPVFGSLLYALGGFSLTSLFLARDLLDVPLSRRRMTFLQKVDYLRDHLWLGLGLGAGTTLLLLVPLLDLLVLPCSVLGGTLLFLAIEVEEGRLTKR